MSSLLRIALAGNPNCGKTALFNQLTGSRQKVANYAGVTVERKRGRLTSPAGRSVEVLDLPGAYSLAAGSPDESITRDVCLGRRPDEALPDMLVCVVDATNLRLNLRFVLELQQLGLPMVLALNMMDMAARRGIGIDIAQLQQSLGMPVIETVALHQAGIRALRDQLDRPLPIPAPSTLTPTPTPTPPHVSSIGLITSDVGDADSSTATNSAALALHQQVKSILAAAVTMPRPTSVIDDRLDRWALHPVIGPIALATIMFMIFQAVFSWAKPIMDMIESLVGDLNGLLAQSLPAGVLTSLLTDGVVAGLGAVIVFLPQILILFFFILVLEESGYLPRAAFLLDKPMYHVGLTGRAFIPLLSSFACAIPGIMATRSIPDSRDRLATILVAPLMTCSARLPVYTLLIAAFIPHRAVWGLFNLQGVVLFVLYVAGIVSAMMVAGCLKLIRREKSEHALLMELPGWRWPQPVNLLRGVLERARIFLSRVTGIILILTVLLWCLSTFPGPPEGSLLPAIDTSLAGQIGKALYPVFAPIGFNWQICVALIPGFAAREVMVAALGTVYAVSGGDTAITEQLGPMLQQQWSLATALSLLTWFVFAPQCMATMAVIRRETNSLKTAAMAMAYLFGLAYLCSLIVYQSAVALGAGAAI